MGPQCPATSTRPSVPESTWQQSSRRTTRNAGHEGSGQIRTQNLQPLRRQIDGLTGLQNTIERQADYSLAEADPQKERLFKSLHQISIGFSADARWAASTHDGLMANAERITARSKMTRIHSQPAAHTQLRRRRFIACSATTTAPRSRARTRKRRSTPRTMSPSAPSC